MQASKRFGQHFLEAMWADKVVSAIDPDPDDRFLEIGPGPGALTIRLAPRVRHVTAIEVDPRMIAALRPKLPANVDLVQRDFLHVEFAPFTSSSPLRVAGNLPYNVSSPILFRLLEACRDGTALRDATLMLQLEVAERIEAAAGTREYGLLAIFVQLQADVRRLLTLPPGAFRPAPKVRSAVVRLAFRKPAVDLPDRRLFDSMVRSMFTQRRKTLTNALRPFAQSSGRSAPEVLAQAGIDPRRRPETLNLEELSALARTFASTALPRGAP